ncbi:MAG: M28 family peptidase [Pirellulales bacterium]
MQSTSARRAAKNSANPATRPAAQIWVIAAIVLVTVAALCTMIFHSGAKLWTGSSAGGDTAGDANPAAEVLAMGRPQHAETPDRRPTAADRSDLKLEDIPFDGQQAYEYLKQLCALGSRTSGSRGMQQQQKLLADHFAKLGAKTRFQRFQVRHPATGAAVPMANLIVTWHPERKERLLLCAHYDTRPYPDSDPILARRRGLFLGANDGASGTALLMQLGAAAAKLPAKHGVDFVLFDGEEFVFDELRDDRYYFLGSGWFAQEYARQKPPHRYTAGVLLDMVADASLELYQERNSLKSAKRVVNEVWAVAAELKVREFIAVPGYLLRDDHLPLNDVAKIPTVDVIDFDYPSPGADSYWHTTQDTPENCSALSLAKVGWVVEEWMKRAR